MTLRFPFASCLVLALSACAPKLHPLVTPEQAAEPEMDLSSRGAAELAGGPAIQLKSPTHGGAYHKSFNIDLSFAPGPTGAPPNMASLKVTYLRGFGFSLTNYLAPYVDGTRLSFVGATMPTAGKHSVEVYIEDTDGNASRRVFTIEFEP